jgi:hypothetical protein
MKDKEIINLMRKTRLKYNNQFDYIEFRAFISK